MDESDSPSWKGHSFTLLVFGGIVVLCSIFFVLGMLVGRNQGQRIAEMAAADEMTRKNAPQPLPDPEPLGFFDRTTGATPDDTLQPRPEPPTTAEGSVPAPARPPEPEPPALKEPVAPKFWLQIVATRDSKEADQALAKVQLKGFRALIVIPKPEDREPLFRVQVGPYDTSAEAAVAKAELLSQGYSGVFQK
jgi:cell division septation protein DedD